MDEHSYIEKEHIAQYNNERSVRWDMADRGEGSAIVKICDIFSRILEIPRDRVSHTRLDEIWFEKYDPTILENEWVKGVPDFIVKILLGKEKYVLIEIKIKSKEFRKTVKGGNTKGGSVIPVYGCNSYYLDIKPVYTNINDFALRANLKFSSYILAFVKDDFSEINMISFAKIKKLVSDGWRKDGKIILIGKYGEGYGQNAYLIPKDATINATSISKEKLEKVLMDFCPLPPP